MKPQSKNQITVIKLLAAATIVLVLGLLAFRTVSNSQFRIVKTSPSGSVLSTSTSKIVIDFNRQLKDIDQQPDDLIQLEPDLAKDVSINEKTLTITLIERPPREIDFTITIDNLTSTDEDVLSTNIKYAVEYVPFNKLSAEERAKNISSVGTPQDRHPLLGQLPHDEISFRVTYIANPETFGTADDWRDEKNNFFVTISTFSLKQGVPAEEYKATNISIRNDALDWIRKLGVDPDDDITIIFAPNDDELNGVEEFTGDGVEPTPEDFIAEPAPNPPNNIDQPIPEE